MAATVTKLSGPDFVGCSMKVATYRVAMDSSYPSDGEAIDLTGDFDYVDGISFIGNDTTADNGYVFGAVVPAAGTAISSSNVLITAHWQTDPADAGGANIPLTEVDATTDLSAVGQLRILVFGR